MASLLLSCATLAACLSRGCVLGQSLYSPIQISVSSPLEYPQPVSYDVLPPATYPVSRVSDECAVYPGAKCMFVLLCLMGGGMAAGPCNQGLLSTCCVNKTHQTTAVRPQVLRQPTVAPIVAVQKVETTQRVDTTDAPVTKAESNYSYCGITKAKPQSRIIGGNDARYGEFPWQAHIKLNKQQCSGVLLNQYYVLTAAHCIYQVDLRDISIQLGIYDIQDPRYQDREPQTFSVVEKKVHPKFQFQASHPDRFDVALLKLNRAVRYHETILPICLPRKGWDFEGWTGIITGWGKTDPGLGNRFGTRLLQKVDVPVLSNDVCEQWHQDKGIDIVISPEMMCAGYEEGQKDACVGDSGGPLMVMVHGRWVVIGLVSAGFGCAQDRQPGIYHRVPSTVDWLRENITS